MTTLDSVSWTGVVKAASNVCKIPLKDGFLALRHIITGSTVGAGMPETMVLLGKETIYRRLDRFGLAMVGSH